MKSKSEHFIVNEATLNDDKKQRKVEYIVSRPGREAIEKIGISVDIKFRVADRTPLNRDYVLWIRPSTIQKIKFSELKEILGVSSKDELLIYNTTSKKYPWAVARLGISTTMLKQLKKEGAAKRGEHFRETAFIVTLAIKAWEKKRVQIPIHSNRGLIEMDYYQNGYAEISTRERTEFRKLYAEFITNKSIFGPMEAQCDKIIDYLKEDIENIDFITKNDSELSINKVASNLLKKIGINVTLPKWNPSDVWIVFKDFKELNFKSIADLNEYLLDSINNVRGIVGISLKQGEGILSFINMNPNRAVHTYDNFTVVGDKKTVVIDFSYRFPGKRRFVGGSTMDCRTFDTKNTSSVYLEVKGSKKAKHMSGKAGTIIKNLMDPSYWEAKEFARKTTNKAELRRYFSDFEFQNEELKDIFFDDLKGNIKTAEQNSRLQSIIIIEWLEWLCESGGKDVADDFISQIVRYARSESNWSAPHLVAK